MRNDVLSQVEEDNDEKLRQIVRDITDRSFRLPRWAVGDTVMHPDGYPVHILGGTLWREYPDGSQRLENRWTWVRVDGFGKPSGEPVSGEGWATDTDIGSPSFGH